MWVCIIVSICVNEATAKCSHLLLNVTYIPFFFSFVFRLISWISEIVWAWLVSVFVVCMFILNTFSSSFFFYVQWFVSFMCRTLWVLSGKMGKISCKIPWEFSCRTHFFVVAVNAYAQRDYTYNACKYDQKFYVLRE